jgi:hypothetical protein
MRCALALARFALRCLPAITVPLWSSHVRSRRLAAATPS